jgi:hypothetical protein
MKRLALLSAALATAFVAAGCVNPEAYYRKIMDSEVGVMDRRSLMDKYGPPTRVDRMGGSEYWTYTEDLGTVSFGSGTSYSTGSALATSAAPGIAQASGYSVGYGSSVGATRSSKDEFTYELNKAGTVVAYRFTIRRPAYFKAYSSRAGQFDPPAVRQSEAQQSATMRQN